MKLPLKRTKLILFGQEMNNRKNTAGEGHCLLIFIPTSQLWWHTFHLPVLHRRCSFLPPHLFTSFSPFFPFSFPSQDWTQASVLARQELFHKPLPSRQKLPLEVSLLNSLQPEVSFTVFIDFNLLVVLECWLLNSKCDGKNASSL